MKPDLFVSAAAVLLAATLVPARAEPAPAERVEISDDGHVQVFADGRVLVDDVPVGETVEPSPEGTVDVFGTTPTWSNTLRRQVGALEIADMNDDDLPDLVVGCYISNSFPPYEDWENLIYYNEGNELEADPSWVSSDEVSTGDIEVGDINGDDHLDFLAGNGGSAMAPSVIYFGSASGPSTTPGWIEGGGLTWTNFALLVDIDDDQDLDVVTANQGNNPNDPYRPMRLYLNDAGTLATAPAWTSDEVSIQNALDAADVDDNGWLDIAVSKWSSFESAVYYNDGGALATTPGWTTGTTDTDRGVAFADVDGDTYPELAHGHAPTELFDNDMGTLTLPPVWTSSATFFGHNELLFFDVDKDGDDDLAEIHFSNGVVNLYLNEDGVLSSSPSWSWDSPAVGTALAFGDLDGDGWPDLAVGNSGDPSIYVFTNRLGDIFADGFESGDTSAWSLTVP